MEMYSQVVMGELLLSIPALLGWIAAVVLAAIMLKRGGARGRALSSRRSLPDARGGPSRYSSTSTHHMAISFQGDDQCSDWLLALSVWPYQRLYHPGRNYLPCLCLLDEV
jgi:transposase